MISRCDRDRSARDTPVRGRLADKRGGPATAPVWWPAASRVSRVARCRRLAAVAGHGRRRRAADFGIRGCLGARSRTGHENGGFRFRARSMSRSRRAIAAFARRGRRRSPRGDSTAHCSAAGVLMKVTIGGGSGATIGSRDRWRVVGRGSGRWIAWNWSDPRVWAGCGLAARAGVGDGICERVRFPFVGRVTPCLTEGGVRGRQTIGRSRPATRSPPRRQKPAQRAVLVVPAVLAAFSVAPKGSLRLGRGNEERREK